ncbi:MAG: DUF998 domain-containing protein [Pseudomonadota bacterium]
MTSRTNRSDQLVGLHSNPADAMLLRICASVAVLGAVLLIASNILGSLLLDNHDWVADTVSDLAAGQLEIIQDFGLYGYGAALIALAIGAAHIRMPGRGWTVSIFALALLAACVTVIGARNEYGDGDNEGVEIHIYLVYGLGVLFAVLFFAAARGLGRIIPRYRTISILCGVAWTVAAPLFFILPTSVDGAWERGLGLITCVWVVVVAAAFWRLARPAEDAIVVRSVLHPTDAAKT